MTRDHISLVETGRIQAVYSLVVLILRRRHDGQPILICTAARGAASCGTVLHGLGHAYLVAAFLIGGVGVGATDRVGVYVAVFNLLLHDGLWLHSLK